MAIKRGLQNVANTVMSVFRPSEGYDSNIGINVGDLPDDAESRASRWLKFARCFNVSDLEREHMPPGDGDSEAMITRDLPRMGIINPENKSQIWELLLNFARGYPILGYNQGQGQACISISNAVGHNADATMAVFSKWAVPAFSLVMSTEGGDRCDRVKAIEYVWTCLGTSAPAVRAWLLNARYNAHLDLADNDIEDLAYILYSHIFSRAINSMCSMVGFNASIQAAIIDGTMQAGVHGPAVSMWAMSVVLCLMEKKAQHDETLLTWSIKNVKPFCQTINSFDVLEEAAPISLAEFVNGYRKALAQSGREL